ncbi:gamma-tubulin complex component 5 [Anabrus simplex]|uniref:gamma-tubulin complex component 5 n=1 Tax=Anabrus simplex TaxID=316456 RepID=UPI0035A2D990
MAGRVKELITPDVRNLIRELTGFNEDEENFHLCEDYAISNLVYHRYLSVDAHAVRRSISGVITKFMIHGHLDISRRLDELVNKFSSAEVFTRHTQYDIQWALLSLLLNLSNNPTSSPHLRLKTDLTDQTHKDEFDWKLYTEMCAVLHEGSDAFQLVCKDDTLSDMDDFSDIQDSPEPEKRELSAIMDLPLCDDKSTSKSVSRQRCKEFISKGLYAEEWLKENVQHSWWNDDDFKHESSTKFPSLNMAQRWDTFKAVQGVEGDTATVSEYKVIREILWVIQASTPTYIFIEENEKFKLRLDVSIPSLTVGAMKNYLNHMCTYLTMISDLRKFRTELYPHNDCLERSVPATFQAYVIAVNEFLRELEEVSISIERAVRKQEDVYTLYTLSMELEPRLVKLRTMYSVHLVAVQGWKDNDNWLAACRLLSVLYSGALASTRDGEPALMLKIFLKSFKPYLDIISTWLSTGRLEDWTDEFIITKHQDESDYESFEEEFVAQPYVSSLQSSKIEALPLLRAVEKKVLHAGRSMEILQKLNRVGDLTAQSCQHGCLYTEFLESVERELSKFVGQAPRPHEKDDDTHTLIAIEGAPKLKKDGLLEEDITDQLKQIDDPYLMNAFEKYINFRQGKRSVGIVELKLDAHSDSHFYTNLSGYLSQTDLPIGPVMERVLVELIDKRHEVACLLVKNILLEEYHLAAHLTVIRAVYLMEAGDIMHQFCSHIFEEVEHEVLWAQSSALTVQLEDCVDLRYPEYSSKFSVVVGEGEGHLSSVLDSMDELSLKYQASWPLTLILSPTNMKYYNAVFQFLLKVKWALWALQQLRFSDLETERVSCSSEAVFSRKINLLKFLRFWLLHSVGSVHTYLMGQVLHSLSLELERGIEKAKDLDTLVEEHNNYVRMVYTHCLQPLARSVIKSAILQLLGVALSLHEIWMTGVNGISEARLSSMAEMYIKCHCFLGSVLQNMVESGQELHLAGLCMALNACHLPT